MWKKEKPKPDLQRFSGKTSLIAVGAELVGDMRFQGAVQVDGRVIGNLLTTEGLVRISIGGVVEGEVRAPHIVVDGEVLGDVYASAHIELGERARVRGDLHYALMEMAMGAQIAGRLRPIKEEDGRPLQLPESLDDGANS